MQNSTGKPWLDRLIRTVEQLIVAGGLTTLVNSLAGGLDSTWKLLVLAGWQAVVTAAQNALEDAGKIPTVLKGSSEAEFAQQIGVPKLTPPTDGGPP